MRAWPKDLAVDMTQAEANSIIVSMHLLCLQLITAARWLRAETGVRFGEGLDRHFIGGSLIDRVTEKELDNALMEARRLEAKVIRRLRRAGFSAETLS